MQCIGPGPNGLCERPVLNMKRSMCKTHYTQWYRGQELRIIKPGRGGHNKKYEPGTLCAFNGCINEQDAKGFCNSHNWQQRKYGTMWPLGEHRKEERKVTEFSVEHTCNTCKQTKGWRSFVMGVDSPVYECRECYRLRLFNPKEPVGRGKQTKKPFTMTDLMDFIDSKTQRI